MKGSVEDMGNYQQVKSVYQRTFAELDGVLKELDACSPAQSRIRAQKRVQDLKNEIQTFLQQSSGVLLKVAKLSRGSLSIAGGRIVYRGNVSVQAFSPLNVFDVIEDQKSSIGTTLKFMSQGGITPSLLSRLGNALQTLYAIYDRANEFAPYFVDEEEKTAVLKREGLEKRRAALEKKLQSEKRDFELSKGLLDGELKRFRFEDLSSPATDGEDVILPIAVSEGFGDSVVEYWNPEKDGALFIDAHDESIKRAGNFLRALTTQYFYAYRNVDRKILYCCMDADKPMEDFFARVASEENGLGKKVFFRGVDQIYTDRFRQETESLFEYLHQTIKDRSKLLSDADAASLAEYNRKENVEKLAPILVIAGDYPNGFENCQNFDYLLEEGGALGIYFVIVKGGSTKDEYAFKQKEMKDISAFSNVVVDWTDDGFSLDGNVCEPLSIDDKKTKELLKPFADFNKKLKKDLTYEELGFGELEQNADGKVSKISIPIARSGMKTYNIDFSCAQDGTIAYLLVGSPGTGKSSLIDAMVVNGAMAYSPDDLIFYMLDFKDGVSSAIYSGENAIPHVRLISENNKEEDANIIISNLERDKERRNTLIKRSGVQNIAEYNAKNPTKKMPRIVVVIDECQVLFKNADLADKCESLVRMGRSVGIHFVLASQTASTDMMRTGKFVDGRFCFEVDESDAERVIGPKYAPLVKTEVPKKSGYVFASRNSGLTCEKIRVAWHGGKIGDYNKKIREKWQEKGYGIKLTVVGESSALTIEKACEKENVFISQEPDCLPFGQNCFDNSVSALDFTENSMRAALVVGKNEDFSTDVLTSLMIGAMKMSCQKGDGKICLIDESKELRLQNFFGRMPFVHSGTKKDYLDILEDFYAEFQKRTDNRREKYAPYFLFIHGLPFITDFVNDVRRKKEAAQSFATPAESGRRLSIEERRTLARSNQESGKEVDVKGRETLLKIIGELNGAPEMYVILTTDNLKPLGEFSRDLNVIRDNAYKIMQADIGDAAGSLTGSSYRAAMMKGAEKNIAFVADADSYSKTRYFRYDLEDAKIEELIINTIQGECDEN